MNNPKRIVDPQYEKPGAGTAVPVEESSTTAQPNCGNTNSAFGKHSIPESDLDKGVVGWFGQDDPAMPLNFSARRKWALVAQISAMTFLSPLSSTIFAPGVSFMDREFRNTNALLSSFVVTAPVLAYVVGSLILGPASEAFGRRPVISAANWWFVLWQICCAVAPNLGALVAFRFLAGIGGAGCLTINGGLIADLFVPEERGGANSMVAIGVIFGPSLGPLLGGFIAQRAGWRWIFWVLAIASGCIAGLMELCNRESYAPVLVARKTKQLSKELGREDLRSCYDAEEEAPGPKERKLVQGLTLPLRMFLSPVVAVFCLYMALVYGLLYLLITTVTDVYGEIYHWSPENTGLAYIGLGVGFLLGLLVIGSTSDKVVIKLTDRNGGVYEPEMRLPYMTLFAVLLPASLFWYGWTTQYAVHWIVPTIALAFFGFGMLGIMFMIQMYMIDAFPVHAASAMAALTVSRSFAGALLPMAGPSLYSSLGLGWGSSLLGFIALVMVPAPWFFWRKGGAVRKRYPVKL